MRVGGIPFVQGRNYSVDSDGEKYAIAIHNTANDATAEAEASYATRRTDNVSSHFYADNNSVVQSLDTEVKAWHAGSTQGNDNAISVEITGINSWSRSQWLSNVDWLTLGKTLAVVCMYYAIPIQRCSITEMKTNPKVKGFYGHNDMRLAWGGTSHTDPGSNFPWDKLLSVVGDEVRKASTPVTTQPTTDQKIHAVYTAVFRGGSSCGKVVPTQYRIDPNSNGNALVDKLNYIQAMLEKLAA